ncbi:MAG: peptidoglycan DD-metalloendopeptidase family protein [Spirochaetes bacterium]|nr:peptidoglycan DD-metalloendopeptidase family protein [Spirochaetota bacterium]
MNKIFQLLLILLFFFINSSSVISDIYTEEDWELWRETYKDVKVKSTVKGWFLPFKTKDRKDIKTIDIISTFGSPRLSYVKGHFHTGIDMIPKKRNRDEYIYVYPVADGSVCSIHLTHPHKTIVIKHRLKDGTILFTSYKHLFEIYPEKGDRVNVQTRLGRLYTREEALKLGGRYDHLHLEIRKKFDDYGAASWTTMSRTNLNKRFYDPWKFIKEKLKQKK